MDSTWLITSELANKRAESTIHLCGFMLKQLLDVVFVISRIIKVKVRVISQSRMLRLITLTSTLIIQPKFIIQLFYYTLNEKNGSHVFASSLMGSKTKGANLI